MDSTIGLIIQFSGIFLIGILFVFLTRSLKSATLRYWTAGWLCLAAALVSLTVGFSYNPAIRFSFALYFLLEYTFCFLMIAGCRQYARNANLTPRSIYALAPAAALAAYLSLFASDLNSVFNIHSLIMGAGFLFALLSLKTARGLERDNFGFGVMRVAVALLAFDFFNYAVCFTFRETLLKSVFLTGYFSFNSIVDLVLEILLGFGMVIVLLEQVRRKVEDTNDKIKAAYAKLEHLAHVDQLTEAFNRHAFHSFLQKSDSRETSGCVGVFDIDNLKPINDAFGHAAGDAAIRETARAIRALVRADDLLFRWGGDEFFVIMFGIDDAAARARMNRLDDLLADVQIDDTSGKIRIQASFGFAAFGRNINIEQAVKRADSEMYSAKRKRKENAEADKSRTPEIKSVKPRAEIAALNSFQK